MRISLFAAVALLFVSAACLSQTSLPFLRSNDVILFQGDSITDGGRQRSGSDFNHIMGQDYAYILAAQIGAESPERDFVFLNRGISGNRVSDLAMRWQEDAIALRPALLSILVGINDVEATGDRAETVDQYEATYDRLLATTIAALPTAKIVLGVPFLLPVGKRQDGYAGEMTELKKRQDVIVRLGAKYHLPVIDYQRLFDEASTKVPASRWSWDGIHPIYAGHGLMAREWLRVVNDFGNKN
jgi:lysophospholipase L1-like esterase